MINRLWVQLLVRAKLAWLCNDCRQVVHTIVPQYFGTSHMLQTSRFRKGTHAAVGYGAVLLVAVWRSGNGIGRINEVALRQYWDV